MESVPLTPRRPTARIDGVARKKMVGRYLVVDPRVCHGKLTFSGTRVPVETVLRHVAKGKSLESVLRDWPELNKEAVEEAIQLAASALEREFATSTKGG
jgi:uncharacterized protein (DUF433 family)